MPLISQGLQQILDLAPQYSTEPTPAMKARAAAASAVAGDFRVALEPAHRIQGLAGLQLRVSYGGQQGTVGPVPWIRVYSRQYSPSAQAGTYLTYLFAADGKRVYLSLMQGTSEFRSGSMRAANDVDAIRSGAAQARNALGDLSEGAAAVAATMSIDLAGGSLRSWDSRRRVRNYEAANILAREYRSRGIPADEQLIRDLYDFLPLLARLYDDVSWQPTETSREVTAPQAKVIRKTGAAAQGPLLDSIVRKKIELYAEDHAIRHFAARGWVSDRVGHLKLGFDLECKNAEGEILHVEVKGTRTAGEFVILTANEARHNHIACNVSHALYVVSQVKVSHDGGISCSGGVANCILPWTIDGCDLIPTEYSYRIPIRPPGIRIPRRSL